MKDEALCDKAAVPATTSTLGSFDGVSGLIFDCDGTVLDTMEWYWPTWVDVCRRHGIYMTKSKFYSCAGIPVVGIFEKLVREQGLEDSIGAAEIKAIVEEKKALVAQRLAEGGGAGIIPCVVDIVKKYHGKVPMAIASSGHREDVWRGLRENGLVDYFDAIICNDDLKEAGGKSKPAPDIFLMATKAIGVSPSECIGFEDADAGMEALLAAGIRAVDVRCMKGHPVFAAQHGRRKLPMNGCPAEPRNIVSVTSDIISLDHLVSLVQSPKAGAVSTFVGTTRDNFEGKAVTRLEYECYDSMAVKEMRRICSECRRSWPDVIHIALIHRRGLVPVGESSVAIAASSPHRAASLEAARYLIDALKATVPVWKKEMYSEGDKGAWKANEEWQGPEKA